MCVEVPPGKPSLTTHCMPRRAHWASQVWAVLARKYSTPGTKQRTWARVQNRGWVEKRGFIVGGKKEGRKEGREEGREEGRKGGREGERKEKRKEGKEGRKRGKEGGRERWREGG